MGDVKDALDGVFRDKLNALIVEFEALAERVKTLEAAQRAQKRSE